MDLLNTLLDNFDEGLMIMTANGQIVLYNKVIKKLSQLLFLPAAVEEGEFIYNIVSPERKQLFQELLKEIATKKTPAKTFAEYKSKKKSTIYLESTLVPVTDEDSNVTHIHLFVRDITAHKAFEKKLITQTTNIANLIEKANAIIIGLDTRGYVTEWNEYCESLTGYSKGEIYAQRFSEIFLDESNQNLFTDLMMKLVSNEPAEKMELSIITKHKKRINVMLSGTTRTTEDNKIVGLTLVGHDITELKEYQKSLEKKVQDRTLELQRALNKEREVVEIKNRFVSIASHEFRAPISSIQHSASFIRNNTDKITKLEILSRLDLIESHIAHMNRLLDDVLTYGKSEAGKIQLVITKIQVKDFMKRIVDDVVQMTKQTHHIQMDFRDVPEEIKSDDKLLRNIITNVLTNAVKFSPGKKQVKFSVTGFEDAILLIIQDEGIGIAPEEVDRMFEPFTRSKNASQIPGTGLGLSIVKKSVELLGGSIKLDSVLNKGTEINIVLPTSLQ